VSVSLWIRPRFDLVLRAGNPTEGNGDGEADQPGSEVTEPGEVPQDEELTDDDDQAGDDVPSPPGVGHPDDQDPGHIGKP
jgi:hypothetical protein